MTDLVVQAEWVTIDSYTLGTPAVRVLNFHLLWEGPAVRGDDRKLPGAAGVRARKRRADITPHTLHLFVDGGYTRAGTVNTNPVTGLETNWFDLRTVMDPYATGDSTRTLTLHLPSGSTKTGAVHVEGLSITERHPHWLYADLDLSLPLGALA